MLLVGLAAFPLYSFTQEEREKGPVLRLGPLLMWLTLAGPPALGAWFGGLDGRNDGRIPGQSRRGNGGTDHCGHRIGRGLVSAWRPSRRSSLASPVSGEIKHSCLAGRSRAAQLRW